MSLDEHVRKPAHQTPLSARRTDVVRARRRRARRVGIGAGLGFALVAVAIAVGSVVGGSGPDAPTVADQSDDVVEEVDDVVEQAPQAGEVAAHWPIELLFTRSGDGSRLLRFRGTSWEDWSVEVRDLDSWRLVNREYPGEDFEPEARGFLEPGAQVSDDEFTRAPSAALNPGWRSATGLGDRVVVGPDDVPGAEEVLARLGLGPDEVEAYVTPNVLGCDRPLHLCIPDGETGARGIAHLPTGMPLYAEEAGYAPRSTMVWLEAQEIRWADSTISPVPVDQIPRIQLP